MEMGGEQNYLKLNNNYPFKESEKERRANRANDNRMTKIGQKNFFLLSLFSKPPENKSFVLEFFISEWNYANLDKKERMYWG